MSFRYQIDWKQVYEAWWESGLSKTAFYEQKFSNYVAGGKIPGLCTLYDRFQEIARHQVTPADFARDKKPGSKKVLAKNCQLIELDSEQLAAIKQMPKQPKRPTAVRLTTPNGSVLEFECAAPELLALKMAGF